jgi:hypothetical protein
MKNEKNGSENRQYNQNTNYLSDFDEKMIVM